MWLADSHNHIHFESFEIDFSEVVYRCSSSGIKYMLLVGIDRNDSLKALEVASRNIGMFVSIGIHPQNAGEYKAEDVYSLENIASDEKVVAIGETGFDLYRAPESGSLQKDLFRAHISLAKKLSLPLVIHDRNAHEQVIDVLNEEGAWILGGVFHCFSGDTRMADKILEKGYYISIPGVVTFNKSNILREVVRICPIGSLLVETDAPYLAPEPFRGKRNEPSYLIKTLEEVAKIKGITPDEAAGKTTENFKRLFLSKNKNIY